MHETSRGDMKLNINKCNNFVVTDNFHSSNAMSEEFSGNKKQSRSCTM
jgi:hypothetical protein